MSIFDIFNANPNPAHVQQPAAAAPPGNIPDAANVATDGTVPAATPASDATPVVAEQENQNPLDEFKTLWDAVPIDKGAPPVNEGFVPLDPVKLQEIVSKASFTNTITPENIQAITAGGEGAVQAFQDSMNAVAQQVMMQSTLAANKMTEQALTKALATQDAKLPQLMRQYQTLDSNPLFTNPAVKPVMEAVQSQLAVKNPNASATELAKMAQNFVTVMGEAFAPKTDTPTDTPNDTDWGKFF